MKNLNLTFRIEAFHFFTNFTFHVTIKWFLTFVLNRTPFANTSIKNAYNTNSKASDFAYACMCVFVFYSISYLSSKYWHLFHYLMNAAVLNRNTNKWCRFITTAMARVSIEVNGTTTHTHTHNAERNSKDSKTKKILNS